MKWSAAADAGAPLLRPLLVETSVEDDPVDDVDDIEEDELVRWMVLRGANMPRGSSGFMALSDCPPLIPHPGRLMLEKLGGLATAVMGTARRTVPDGGRGGSEMARRSGARSRSRKLFSPHAERASGGGRTVGRSRIIDWASAAAALRLLCPRMAVGGPKSRKWR